MKYILPILKFNEDRKITFAFIISQTERKK